MNVLVKSPPLYFFGSIFLCLVGYFIIPSAKLSLFPFNLLGFLLIISGLIILRGASMIFNEKRTTFILEKPTKLVKESYFRVSRNPMYLGSLIFIAGISLLLPSFIGFASILLFYLAINFLCIPPEEKLMEKTFGSEYLDYKKNVRKWI